MKKLKIKRSTVNTILKLFGLNSAPIRSIVTVFILGMSAGVAYEEIVGIGTWHSYHPKTDKFNVCFTPPSGCGDLIAQQIALARSNIYVQAYGLTSMPIIYQLKAAKSRGVKVKVLLDNGNLSDNKEVFSELESAGIEVAFDKLPGIAHNKVMVIDNRKVITGSFNFTNAADTRNAENVILVDDQQIAAKYLDNWLSRKSSTR